MTTKTDNPAEVGLHVFERAGLGRAPFKVVGSQELKWQAYPGAPMQPGGSCDYCGTGIMYAVAIRSSDGRNFKVGCDCVRKTGDAGLLKQYRNLPAVRAANRAKAAGLDARKAAEWAALVADPENRAKLAAHTVPTWDGTGTRPWITMAETAWGRCGAAGRARYLKAAKKILSGELT